MKVAMRTLAALALAAGVLASCADNSPPFWLGGLKTPKVRTPYEAQLKVKGHGAGVTFAVSAGRLPFGLALEPDGRLHGVPVAVQEVAFSVTATTGEEPLTASATWTVTDPDGMRLLSEDLPVAVAGEPYVHALRTVPAGAGDFRIVRARSFNAGAGDPNGPLPSTDQVPAWLSLSADGVLSGTPEPGEVLVLLLIEARDGQRTALEAYALRVGDPAVPGWLLAKSERYVDYLFGSHLPSGLHLSREATGCYANYGDSCCWTGTAMGGLAFRAAVTGTEAALDQVGVLLEGLRTLRRITGVPGLPGRAYEHRENADGACGDFVLQAGVHPDHYEGTGEFEGYRFWTETSRDQFTGNLWGHAVVYETLPQRADYRALAAENITAMVSHVWDNEMKIVDVDGLATKYGVMSAYGFDGVDPYVTGWTQFPNGFNALLIVNWFQMAAEVAPDEATREAFASRLRDVIATEPNPEPGREFEHSYLEILDQSYAYSAYSPAPIDYFVDTSWYNVHMSFSNYFHAVRWARDPDTRSRLLESFRTVLWEDTEPMASGCDKPAARRARRESNPHYSFEYLAAFGDRDAEAIFESLTQLMYFVEPPRRDYVVSNSAGVATVPGHDDWACDPVPVHLRPPSSNYLWHRSPYVHTGGLDRPDNEDGGIDGFVPYWMGRYFGFIPSNI